MYIAYISFAFQNNTKVLHITYTLNLAQPV